MYRLPCSTKPDCYAPLFIPVAPYGHSELGIAGAGLDSSHQETAALNGADADAFARNGNHELVRVAMPRYCAHCTILETCEN
jgi:hypothetical protein